MKCNFISDEWSWKLYEGALGGELVLPNQLEDTQTHGALGIKKRNPLGSKDESSQRSPVSRWMFFNTRYNTREM